MSGPPPEERRLVSVRRRVPAGRRAEYDAAWAAVRAGAEARGAHAWRFRAAETEAEESFLEFLEFRAGADPRRDPEVAEALRALHASSGEPPPVPDEWIETP